MPFARKLVFAVACIWLILCAVVALSACLLLLLALLFTLPTNNLTDVFAFPALWPQTLSLLARTGGIALLALLFSLPFAFAYALVMSRLRRGTLRSLMTLLVHMHASLPSVLFGLLGATALIPVLAYWGSAWANLGGILILSFMILPTVVASLERAFSSVSPAVCQASIALGATSGHVFLYSVFPQAWRGIVSGCFFALSRLFSETAALLLVMKALQNTIGSRGLFSAGTLTTEIFALATSGGNDAARWCAMLALLVVSLALSIAAHHLEPEVRG